MAFFQASGSDTLQKNKHMVYIFGTIGFISGFAAGLFIVYLFTRSYSGRELVENKSLRWTYGLAVWVFAGLGVWAGIWMYGRYY